LFIQQIIANAQKQFDAIGILIDRENAYTKQRGKQLGINNSNLIIVKPADIPTVTDAFMFIISTVEEIRSVDQDVHIVIGIDSISAFGKDVDLDKSDSGRKAKATHEGLRDVLKIMDTNVLLLVANQVTYKIGVNYGDPRTTTAGESMKYYSTVRFALEDLHKIIDPKKGNEVIGNWIGIETIKTRLGPSYRTCYLPHFYKTGIDYYGGYMRLLVDRGYLKPKNKEEFKKFKGKQVVLDKEVYSEDDIQRLFEKHPELKFDTYPEYNSNEKDDENDAG
jgi:RecA/RadA recombinase